MPSKQRKDVAMSSLMSSRSRYPSLAEALVEVGTEWAMADVWRSHRDPGPPHSIYVAHSARCSESDQPGPDTLQRTHIDAWL